MTHAPQRSPVGEALMWASRIMAVGLAMCMPAIAGSWLDARLGTRFVGLIGLIVGFIAGITWLVQLGRRGPA